MRRLAIPSMLALVWLCSCTSDDMPALRVGANVWPGYELLHLAGNLDYYKDARVRVIDFPSAIETIRSYRNGVLDAAALTADEALSVVASEPGVHSIVLVMDYSNGADALLVHPPLAQLREIKGKRVGAESSALGALMLARALDAAQMTPGDVVIVTVPFDRQERAYQDNEIDAIVTFEPRRSRLINEGAREVFSSAEIPGEVLDVLLVRRSVIRERPHDVNAVVEGWLKAQEYVQREPSAAAERIAKYRGSEARGFTDSLRLMKLIDRETNRRLLGPPAEIKRVLENVAKTMTDYRLLDRDIDWNGIVDGRFVASAKL